MSLKCDIHIHTNISACAVREMTLAAVVKGCERLGHRFVGISDHINHPDHVARNATLRPQIEQVRSDVRIYFGGEDNYLPEFGGHSVSLQLRSKFGYQYVIGSHHNLYVPETCKDLETIVRAQHEHHLETCRHPAMDILGHPFRYLKGTLLERCGRTPEAMEEAMPDERVRELGRVARETGTAVEINTTSFLCAFEPGNPFIAGYRRLVDILAEERVTFALGSDAHRPAGLDDILPAWDLMDRMGISDDRIWRPEGE